jgi:hypothetical protein
MVHPIKTRGFSVITGFVCPKAEKEVNPDAGRVGECSPPGVGGAVAQTASPYGF